MSEKLMNIDKSDTIRARDSIYIQNSFKNFEKILTYLKSPDYKPEKVPELSFDENAVTFCLKNYMLNAKFRLIGCIYPNTGYHSNVKETLMFLYKCKKTMLEYTIQDKKTEPEKQRDEEIYQLKNRTSTMEKTITKLKEKITELETKNK